jgi:aspartate/glutamate racemase
MTILRGGHNHYGFTIGIITLETQFPRVVGDIGNALTFPFPVLYRPVPGASVTRVVLDRDRALLQPFIEAGHTLVREGVKALVTTCGFLAMFQREMSQALPVPVYTSSLMQIPLAYVATGQRRVGVLTVNSETLTDLHFASVGARGIPVAIEGIQETHFGDVLIHNRLELDLDQAKEDVLGAARRLVAKHPDIGSIVLECTNLPPFAKAVQEAVELPIFDIISLVHLAYTTAERKPFYPFRTSSMG